MKDSEPEDLDGKLDRLSVAIALGDALCGAGTYDKAVQLFRETLEALKRLVGDNSVRVLILACKLAAALQGQGEMVEAGDFGGGLALGDLTGDGYVHVPCTVEG